MISWSTPPSITAWHLTRQQDSGENHIHCLERFSATTCKPLCTADLDNNTLHVQLCTRLQHGIERISTPPAREHAQQAVDCHQNSLMDVVQIGQLLCTQPHFEGLQMKQVQEKEAEHAEVERTHVGCRPVMIQSLVVVDGFSHQHVLVHENNSVHLSWCISLVARRLMECPTRMKADFPCSAMTIACLHCQASAKLFQTSRQLTDQLVKQSLPSSKGLLTMSNPPCFTLASICLCASPPMPKSLSNNSIDYWTSQTLCNVSDHAKTFWPDAGHSIDCEQAEREHSQSAGRPQ